MPNWCSNNMTVKGPKSELKRFLKSTLTKEMQKRGELKDGEWVVTGEEEVTVHSLNHLDPIPEELLNTVSGSVSDDKKADHEKQMKDNLDKYGYKDWYDYANAVWGSKWGASDVDVSDSNYEESGKLGFYFQSAWTPCDGLIRRISEQFPKLVFAVTYTEEADFFAGWCVIHNGHFIATGTGETQMPQEIEEMPTDTDEQMDEYYEAMNEWQCERNDKLDDACDKATEMVEQWIRSNARRKEKLSFREFDDYLLDKS